MTKNSIIKFFASGFYSSYSPFIPGTTGTNYNWVIILAIALTIISVFLSHLAEGIYGHDAKKIVIDEWAGMFVTLLFVPFSLTAYAIGFVAFRAFDVVKVPPAAQLESLPRGWGVTMDDVMAGIYANIVTQLIVRFLLR